MSFWEYCEAVAMKLGDTHTMALIHLVSICWSANKSVADCVNRIKGIIYNAA